MKKTFAAVAAIAAGALALAGGSAVAETGERAAGAKITMEFSDKTGPTFGGDSSIIAGEKLKIVNLSDPSVIGPHTLTLVNKADLPSGRKCTVCNGVEAAHEVTKRGKVRKPLVDNGDEGWDEPFTKNAPGDSWYTETKRENLVQVVSPEAGRKLFFFCAIHTEMQGKLKVTRPE